MTYSKEQILETLKQVTLPNSNNNVVDSGVVSSVVVKEGQVGCVIDQLDGLSAEDCKYVREACETTLKKLDGITTVMAVFTEDVTGKQAVAQKSSIKVEAKSAPKAGITPPTPKPIPHVKHIIAVASGKGGVGKSTIATNLATTLNKQGYRTGLVDADIHGPSVARMMGMEHEPEVDKQGKMIPIERHGVHCMSMGAILEEDVPVVWRGPMISKALNQLMLGAKWGSKDEPLDYLILDLPPGTGDIQLSLIQNYPIAGVIMVSTPQQVSLLDVKKAVSMFRKVNIPVLGAVENMAYIQTNNSKTYPFGTGNIENYCDEQAIPYLGAMPLESNIAEQGDNGQPYMFEKESASVDVQDVFRHIISAISNQTQR